MKVRKESKQFWLESVSYFWWKRNNAKTRREWKDNDELLEVSLERVRAMLIILVLLFISGCETLGGMAADIHHITRPRVIETAK